MSNPTPPGLDLYGGSGGSGGQGYPGGAAGLLGTIDFSGANGSIGHILSQGFGSIDINGFQTGSGGSLGSSGTAGTGTSSGGAGAAGSSGSSGAQGARGPSILGYNNITQIAATGTIVGDTSNNQTFSVVSSNISYATGNYSFSNAISVPAEANVGDIAILFDLVTHQDLNPGNGPVPTKIIPSGWTEISDASSNSTYLDYDARSVVSYKILEQGDPGSSLSSMADQFVKKIILVFRTNEIINNVVISTANSMVSSSSIGNVAYDLSAQTGPLLLVSVHTGESLGTTYAIRSNNLTMGSAYLANNRQYAVKFAVFNSTDQRPNTVFNQDDSGTINMMQSFFIKVN